MVANIDWSSVKVIVELGGGTGPITKLLAERAPASCTVVVIERDHDFAALLRHRYEHYPNFHIFQDDVRHLDRILAELNITQVDHILSGLPSPSLPIEVRNAVFRVARQVLTPTGTFNNITEVPWYYKRWYHRHFHHVHFRFIPRNIPPGGVYYCRGVKGNPT